MHNEALIYKPVDEFNVAMTYSLQKNQNKRKMSDVDATSDKK